MKMLKLIYCLLGFNLLAFSQDSTKIKVTTIDGSAIENVSLYEENVLIGTSNVAGEIMVVLKKSQDYVFIKAGFQERKIPYSEFSDEIVLFGLGVQNLEAVQLVSRDVAVEFRQLLAKTKMENAYLYKSDNAVFNSLISDEDTLHFLNNNVYWLPYKGLHIENNKGVVKNFDSYVYNNGTISNIYVIEGAKIELSSKFSNRTLNISYLNPFIELNRKLTDYNFYFSQKGDTIEVNFEPKKNLKYLSYTGRILYNQTDYGIYEMEFTSIGNRKYDTYINGNKKTKVSLTDYDEYLFTTNRKNDDGVYVHSGGFYSLKTEVMNTAAKGRILKQEFRLTPIQSIKPQNPMKFNLFTYEYE